jgi:hypothetical protein
MFKLSTILLLVILFVAAQTKTVEQPQMMEFSKFV